MQSGQHVRECHTAARLWNIHLGDSQIKNTYFRLMYLIEINHFTCNQGWVSYTIRVTKAWWAIYKRIIFLGRKALPYKYVYIYYIRVEAQNKHFSELDGGCKFCATFMTLPVSRYWILTLAFDFLGILFLSWDLIHNFRHHGVPDV